MNGLSATMELRFTRFPNPPGAGRRDLAASLNARPSKRQP
jgi:hypothetical protein